MNALAKLPAWLLGPALLGAMIALNPLTQPSYLMGDFRAFYCAGQAIAHGANPYLIEPLRSCENSAGPPAQPAFLQGVALPAPLPPPALALFVPLSMLPFALAAAVYCALLIAAMCWSTAIFARLTGVSNAVLSLAFACITATVTYYVGQPVPLVLLALALAAQELQRGRWWPAAACIGAAMLQPHLALPVAAGAFAFLPRMRMPLLAVHALLVLAALAAVGPATSIAYVREVLPAHALANAYEWQFSLTSLLTSLGTAAPRAIMLGELMFVMMTLLGTWCASRLLIREGDAAVMVLLPPAFAVFGGVHVHFQQIVIAFPAFLYVFARYPHVRVAAAAGLGLAMIPWNVMGSSLLAACSPLIVGSFCAMTLGRRAGLLLSALAALILISVLVLAQAGFGPAQAHPMIHHYAPSALAESSWADFSRAALMRPSVMMQWLRIPTLAGLACGLCAVALACLRTPPQEGEAACA